MKFVDQPPSKQWVGLKFRGQDFAGVWFKPEGDPHALTFRIPRTSFDIPGMDQLLTTENLLKSIGIATGEVESWRLGETIHAGEDGSNAAFSELIAAPSADEEHLDIHLTLKSDPEATPAQAAPVPEVTQTRWQDLEARYKAIVSLEATMEGLRQRMESLRAEMEGAARKSLTGEERVHALNADVAQWSKAKNRVHHSVPKAKEYIHRATWALGLPERKRLEELFQNFIRPHISFPEIDETAELMETLLKDRQILLGHGTSVLQECQTIASEIQSTLRTVQTNAANRKRKHDAAAKGKSFT
jgi:hypothetical protein